MLTGTRPWKELNELAAVYRVSGSFYSSNGPAWKIHTGICSTDTAWHLRRDTLLFGPVLHYVSDYPFILIVSANLNPGRLLSSFLCTSISRTAPEGFPGIRRLRIPHSNRRFLSENYFLVGWNRPSHTLRRERRQPTSISTEPR